MGFLDRILGNKDMPRSPWDLSRVATVTEQMATHPVMLDLKGAYDLQRVGIQGRPQYPDTDMNSLLKAYTRNEIVYAAIDAKASSVIDPRLLVQTRNGDGEWQEAIGHPTRQLLMEPNEQQDEAMLFAAYIISLDITGRYVEEIVRGKNGLPIQLHPLNSAKLAPIPRSDGKRDWQYKDGTDKVILKAEDVLVRELWNPANRWQPISPLTVALGSVDADSAQTDYLRAFFNNAGVPSGILTIKGRKLTQAQADEMKAKWMAKYHRSQGRQHDVAILDEDAAYQKIGANLDEINSETIRTFTESRIAMVFKVPSLIIYSYAGMLRSDYSNLKIAWKAFADFTLSPLLKSYRNWRARTLLPQFVSKDLILGERIRFAWDLSECAWAQDDVNEIHARARENFRVGGITLNQFLGQIGEPADAQGDYYVRSIAMITQPANEPVDEALLAPAPPKMLQLKAPEQKASRQALERKVEKKVRQLIMRDYSAMAEIVRGAA